MGKKLIIERAKIRGHHFRLESQRLSSKYDPIKEAQNIIADYRGKVINSTKNTEVLILGFFPVYHIHFIRKLNPKLKLGIVEEAPIDKDELHKVWELTREEYSPNKHGEVTSWDGITLYLQVNEVIHYLEKLSPKKMNDLILIPSPYCSKKIMSTIIHIHRELLKKVRVEEKTTDYFTTLWNLNTLNNLKHSEGNFIDSLKWVNNKNSQPTAFLVSSGPITDEVLTQHHSQVVTLAQKYPFIAVPGIVGRLIDLKVPLAAIFTTDSGFANTYHFSKLWKYRHTLPLIAPLTIHPGIARHWPNKFFYWDMEEHAELFAPLLGRENFIPTDASVVLSALRYLAHLNCRQIYTIGIDFMITPFKEHADSNTSQEILFNQNTRLNNYTTATHNIYHKHMLPSPIVVNGKKWYQTQSLQLYHSQFLKIKNNFIKRGIEIAPFSSFTGKKDNTSVQSFKQGKKNNRLDRTLRYIYDKVKDNFKSHMLISTKTNYIESREVNIPSKEKWFSVRWERL